MLSDEPQAHTRIERFARGDANAPRWLVAVNMVSEGVDVPRLVLAAYATVKRTDLFFRQAVGRVVRRRPNDPADLVATVFLPADPTLTGCAERVEVELRQQVGDEVGADFDVEPPPGLAHRPDFQPLDAQVEPGGMIVAGVHYARAEVDAARRLLRELGQSERALRSVLEFVRRERVGGGAPPPTPVPAHRRVEHKRRALDRLARRWAQLRREIDPDYTWPQAQARVNRAMGVRRRADAGEPELDAGLAFLRTELTKLARDYPEQAERLRIPGSVEGIDQRRHGTGESRPPPDDNFDTSGRTRSRPLREAPDWSLQLNRRHRRLHIDHRREQARQVPRADPVVDPHEIALAQRHQRGRRAHRMQQLPPRPHGRGDRVEMIVEVTRGDRVEQRPLRPVHRPFGHELHDREAGGTFLARAPHLRHPLLDPVVDVEVRHRQAQIPRRSQSRSAERLLEVHVVRIADLVPRAARSDRRADRAEHDHLRHRPRRPRSR